ncbi:MAG: glycerol-3-phosphate 1-O-acyltransferase PlsY [Hyphomicrobium sp.]|jgi:glycerol-3-phosphate acyltransferase PlsY
MIEACGILGAMFVAAVADAPDVVYTAEPLSLAAQLGGRTLPLALGYLLGSIPFGLILTRLAGLRDIRTIGSGNIGATNVLRTGHKGLAAATLLLDALKGTIAVLLGYEIGARHGLAVDGALLAGLGAFLGHVFPVWLGFKGGKGVATYIGILIGLYWPAAVVFCGVWLTVASITRYSSLSALTASVTVPIALLVFGEAPAAVLAALLSALLLWKHSANIKRLLAGEEPRIGGKA